MPMYPHTFITDADGNVNLDTDLLASADVTSTNPMTVVYKIKPDAVWSDGTPITADDFKFTWQVQNPKTCPKCLAAFTAGYSSITAVTGSDNGKTVTVSFETPFQPWKSLFTYILPAHIAAQSPDLATAFNEQFGKNVPTWSGGPYIIKQYDTNSALIYTKNPKWYGAPAHLDQITFRIIAGTDAQLTALQSGEIQLIDVFPTVDAVNTVKQLPKVSLSLFNTRTYYQMISKASGDPLGDVALRRAISIATPVQAITARTIGQFMPSPQTQGSVVYEPGQKLDGIPAYQDNATPLKVGTGDLDAAKQTLTAAGYTIKNNALYKPNGDKVRTLSILTLSTDPMRVQMAEIEQSQLASLGISTTINSVADTQYISGIFAKNYDLLMTGTALDLGTLSIAQWYATGASRNSMGYSNSTVDELLAKAAVTLDSATVVKLLNQVDVQLLTDGVTVPFFPSPSLVAYSSQYTGIQPNPSKWGITSTVTNWAMSAGG
jgi:peptide/nickel transport system substrate-binding protein